jgi:uncharacterized protein (TIGR03083 family)
VSTEPTSRPALRVEDVTPIAVPESVTLAATETARMAALLRALDPEDWRAPTDCPAWDVRAMAGHVLGMTEGFTSLRRMVSGMVAGRRRAGDGPFVDGLTAVQVERNSGLDTATLVRRLEVAGPRQARWRGRVRLLRPIPMTERINGEDETWRMGFLLDVVLTRDTWMHRVDVTRATGRSHELTPDHDGRIVGHVVAEWARRHGRPFVLHLTGPAGGSYVHGEGGEEITIDAVEFCRTLSGRGPGDGLLATQVPF